MEVGRVGNELLIALLCLDTVLPLPSITNSQVLVCDSCHIRLPEACVSSVTQPEATCTRDMRPDALLYSTGQQHSAHVMYICLFT